jgi:hypothetical protein
MTDREQYVGALAAAAGRLAAVPLGALARRRQGTPIHPVFDGVLERGTGPEPVGVWWLDAPGADPVVVRLSRAAGLPAPLPDVLGLAVRISAGDEPVDLLLSSTVTAPLLRMLPVPRAGAATAYTSIMGYRSDAGTLRLAALPERRRARSEPAPLAGAVAAGGLRFTFAAARGQGPWRPFGRLTLSGPRLPLDRDVRFDAVGHPPHGLVPDGPLARFRAAAHAAG